MNLGLDPVQQNLVIAFFSAMSVFCAIIMVSWPYMARDPLADRMRRLANERERIRLRERARLGDQRPARSLRRVRATSSRSPSSRRVSAYTASADQ
jgi:tight adherence protein C